MAICTKDLEIELSDGTIVETKLTVWGSFDDESNVDIGEPGDWVITGWKTAHDEKLNEEQLAEFEEKIEESVFSEEWDFEVAAMAEDEDEIGEE